MAVELANPGGWKRPSEQSREMFAEHGVAWSGRQDLGTLPDLVREALGQIVDETSPAAVHSLLERYPPQMHLSNHDGRLHVHFAHDGERAEDWLGRIIAAHLAMAVAGDPAVALGRCAAETCGNFFVDQSRNRTRRFCGNACASRTTVAAYRARATQERT